MFFLTEYDRIQAQFCNNDASFTITVENHYVILTAITQNGSWTYSWEWTYPDLSTGSASGFTAAIPVPPYDDPIIVDITVNTGTETIECDAVLDIKNLCEGSPNFSWDDTGCRVCFTPSSPYATQLNETWNFGDSSPESNDNAPCHLYTASGTYEVYHAVVFLDPFDGKTINVWFCEQELEVDCGSSGYMLHPVCCKLEACFETNIEADSHSWDFQDGSSSTEEDPCHLYTNFSTYATPDITVEHCWTIGATTLCEDVTVNFNSAPGIYVGTDETSVTNLSVISSINGAGLFPGSSMGNPSPIDNDIAVHVAGELQISKTFTFEDVAFCMDPEAGIRVNDTKTLTVQEGSYFNRYPTCDIWRSIDIQQTATPATKLDFYDTTIESALFGIRILDDGPIVKLRGMDFRNNFIGLYAPSEFTLSQFDDNEFSVPTIVGNLGDLTLTGLPVGLYQLSRFAGILGDNITFSIPNSTATPNTNWFHDLTNGIWTDDCNARIRRCRFTDINQNFYGANSGIGIRFNDNIGSRQLKQTGLGQSAVTMSFENIENNAIEVFTTDVNTLIESQENNMVNVRQGYSVADFGNLDDDSYIRQNDIDCYGGGIRYVKDNTVLSHLLITNNNLVVNITEPIISNGISLTDISPSPAAQNIDVIDNDILLEEGESGIALNSFRGAYVSLNDITITDENNDQIPNGILLNGGSDNLISCKNAITGIFATSAFEGRGIFSDGSQDNTIEDNLTAGTRSGLHFVENCGMSTVVHCNSMDNHDIGLFYQGSNAITGPQNEQGNSWGTTWVTGSDQAIHQSAPIIVSLSIYTAAFGTNQYPVSPSPAAWFQPSGNPPVECPDCVEEEMMMFFSGEGNSSQESDYEAYISIADGSLAESSDDPAFGWGLRRYLYEELLTTSASDLPGILSDFMQYEASTSVGTLSEITRNISDMFGFSPETEAEISSLSNEIHSYTNQVMDIDDDIAFSTSDTEQESLLAERLSLITSMQESSTSLGELMDNWLNTRTTGAEEILPTNESVVTEGIYDENEKSLSQIYLQTVLPGIGISPAQIAVITDVAGQCPQDGGRATYWARAWYYSLTGIYLSPECDEPVERSGQMLAPGALAHFLNVAPNPAQHEVVVYIPSMEGILAPDIDIFDPVGRVISHITIVPGQKFLTMDVSDWPSGIYWVSLNDKKHRLATTRFIVIR